MHMFDDVCMIVGLLGPAGYRGLPGATGATGLIHLGMVRLKCYYVIHCFHAEYSTICIRVVQADCVCDKTGRALPRAFVSNVLSRAVRKLR